MFKIHLLALLFIGPYFVYGESPRWEFMHQDKYAVDVHHIAAPWHNKSYLKIEKFEMVKFNRTFRRVFNGSFYLYKELGTDLKVKLQFYKLLSNVYKFFPITMTLQICQEYERNSFELRDLLTEYTNFRICPQKPGYLYAVHLRGRHNRFPPLIPSGHYKLCGTIVHQDHKLIDMEMYGSIIYQ